MKTLFITIGNSDNKLKQGDWAYFCDQIRKLVNFQSQRIYGIFYSLPDSQFQNACFSFACDERDLPIIRGELSRLCGIFEQDSIALNICDDTEMVQSQIKRSVISVTDTQVIREPGV